MAIGECRSGGSRIWTQRREGSKDAEKAEATTKDTKDTKDTK